MIKASSLVYAIYICVLVSILCAGLLYWHQSYRTLQQQNYISSSLVDHCNSCVTFGLSNPNLVYDQNITRDLFENKWLCTLRRTKWGLLDILSATASFKKDSVASTYMIGQKFLNELDALYLSDLSEELKISGTTRIEGALHLPKKGYEITNILGNQQINNPKITGKISTSQIRLPALNLPRFSESNSNFSLEDLQKTGKNFNSFSKKSILVQLPDNAELSNISLKGNFVLNSTQQIIVRESAQLEDVILKSKSISISDNFTGALQAWATENISIGSNVLLSFPSAVIVNNTEQVLPQDTLKIDIGKNSKIFGAVVLNAEKSVEKQQKRVVLHKESEVTGITYCTGTTELYGNVNGSVFTDFFEYNTDYSSYTNLLLNSSITNINLPDNFVQLPLFENEKISSFETIKKIQ